MSSYRSYRGQCIGRILHFLYHCCGYNVACQAEVGPDYVKYFGGKILTYRWLNETDDIPVFTFLGPDSSVPDYEVATFSRRRKFFEENYKVGVYTAIMDQEEKKPEPCRECRRLKLQLDLLKR